MGEEIHPTTPSVNFVNGKTPVRANLSPYTHRPLGRASTFADVPSSSTKRRGSMLSDSLDEARQSIRSSTENLFLPRPNSPHLISSGEHSYWHSAPLALALLPALGGLFFKNGSALVTDLTLLGLAAVFLHWSVTLPWSVPPIIEVAEANEIEEGTGIILLNPKSYRPTLTSKVR